MNTLKKNKNTYGITFINHKFGINLQIKLNKKKYRIYEFYLNILKISLTLFFLISLEMRN